MRYRPVFYLLVFGCFVGSFLLCSRFSSSPLIDDIGLGIFSQFTAEGHRMTDKEKLIDTLAQSLRTRLSKATEVHNITISTKSCREWNITNYNDTCRQGRRCLRTNIPEELYPRIASLVFPPNLRIPDRYRDVLEDMRRLVTGHYDVIILHALSSNHFRESQAMLKNLHDRLFPVLTNFTMIVYDLGLNPKERQQYQEHCRCQLFTFPFHKLPEHFKTLKTFSWKIFVIAAHFEQAEVTMWTDASITLTNPPKLLNAIEKARTAGVQQRCNSGSHANPVHTLPQMFEAFGDSPCVHMAFRQCETGWALYHREPLVRHAVMEPWLACASHPHCISPVPQAGVQVCAGGRPGHKDLGLCMRSDKSAITLILAKLFREKFNMVAIQTRDFQSVNRSQKVDYFNDLEKKSKMATVFTTEMKPKTTTGQRTAATDPAETRVEKSMISTVPKDKPIPTSTHKRNVNP